ncbi:MAG TPA: vitamin K epoxide reductase family protein [Chloroflexota bacterium]|nr:vitamin K epoxide reductase family protein [Chloroflexota bacterium]
MSTQLAPGRVAEIGIAGVGLAISAYLTVAHYASAEVTLACPATSTINCAQVTTSAASYVGPIPVALLGFLWFLAMLALVAMPSLAALGRGLVVLGWAAGGLLFVFYLVYAELFRVGAICLWCSAVHLCVIALFLLALNAYVAGGSPEDQEEGTFTPSSRAIEVSERH